jgi:hypothetical protein
MVEKTWDSKNEELWCCFVDFRKAFDMVPREKLWARLIELGVLGMESYTVDMLYK